MNDSRIHRNMKITRNDNAVKLDCCDWCSLPLNASKRISEQALSCLLEWRTMLVIFFIIPVLILNIKLYVHYHNINVSCVWFLLPYACNLTECENLQNSDNPFRFLFEDFCLCLAILTSIEALSIFTNLCLLFWCYLSARLFRNFTFNQRNKGRE